MSRSKKTVLLAGATGLVGKQCLSLLLKTPAVGVVVPVVRRPISEENTSLRPLVSDFAVLDSRDPIPAEVALCALGTTMKRAGSRESFRSVDYEAVLSFARFAARSGVKTFGLISSVGATAGSRNFYLQVKGETEDAVAALGFRSFVALRPSLLLGSRDESRPGEAVTKALSPLFSPLLQGSTRRFRAIESEVVARALSSLAVHSPADGVHIWQYDEIGAASAK